MTGYVSELNQTGSLVILHDWTTPQSVWLYFHLRPCLDTGCLLNFTGKHDVRISQTLSYGNEHWNFQRGKFSFVLLSISLIAILCSHLYTKGEQSEITTAINHHWRCQGSSVHCRLGFSPAIEVSICIKVDSNSLIIVIPTMPSDMNEEEHQCAAHTCTVQHNGSMNFLKPPWAHFFLNCG